MTDEDTKVGTVTHYYTHLSVGTVKLDKGVKKGDRIRFKGYTTDFGQVLDDMQFEHQPVEAAEAGQEVGIKVTEKVREGDGMYVD